MQKTKSSKFSCIYFNQGFETRFVFQEKPAEIQPANSEDDLANLKKEVEELPMSEYNKSLAISAAENAVKAEFVRLQQLRGVKEGDFEVVGSEIHIAPEAKFARGIDFIRRSKDYVFNENFRAEDVEYIVALKIKTSYRKTPQAIGIALDKNYKVIGMAD